jgi:hypothetical protein
VTPPATTASIAARIGALDLEPIVFKLLHPEAAPPPMTLARADAAVTRYRAFLALLAAGHGPALAPTAEIDAVWHAHILDTAKYADDCHAFGHFIHHFPYLGLRGPADAAALQAAAARTRQLLAIPGSPGTPGRCQQGDGQTCNGWCDSHSGKAAAALDRPRPDRAAPDAVPFTA